MSTGTRALTAVVALALGALTSACGALDRALSDPGDEALVADASTRAHVPVDEPEAYRTRPVTLLVDAAGRGSSARTATDAGTCGWSGGASWRAGLGTGAVTAAGDDDGLVWTVLDVVTAPGATAGAPGTDGDRVLDAVMTGSFQQGPGSPYEQVEQQGRVEVSASGLSARFTADPVPSAPDGEEQHVPAVAVEIACGRTPDHAQGRP
ncbi:hypothetical protein [Aquipuribacter sp. MA13-6]|uniref:hypothetical protein n=1 Tax=unclassified Aquipuribacter TaxID=2635084 RepID=UPI003EEDEE3C